MIIRFRRLGYGLCINSRRRFGKVAWRFFRGIGGVLGRIVFDLCGNSKMRDFEWLLRTLRFALLGWDDFFGVGKYSLAKIKWDVDYGLYT